MTTPAINRDILTTRTTVRHQKNMTTGVVTDSVIGPTVTRWDKEHRPASVSVPMINGFRQCTNWHHDWADHYVANTGEGILRPSFGTQIFYTNGDHWSGGNNMDFPSPGSPPAGFISSLEVKALNRLKNQDVNLGTFLAEARQTINMVAGATRRIAQQVAQFQAKHPGLWQQVKAVQIGGLARDLWCNIPSQWLEIQYGWNPLMSDIYGSMLHLWHRNRFRLSTIHVSSYGKTETDIEQPRGGQNSSGVKLNFRAKHEVRVFLTYQMSSPQLAEVSSLGLVNPLEIIWEIIPYSFVVDWFLPVGPWLSSLTGDVGMSFKTGGRSLKSTVKFVNADVYAPPAAAERWDAPKLGGSVGTFDRTSYATSPFPGLYVKSPLSVLHALNGIALLMQRLR